MVPVVAVGLLVVVTVVAAVGVSSLAAGQDGLLGEESDAGVEERAVSPSMAVSLVVEGQRVTAQPTDGSRVPVATLTLELRWGAQVERVPFSAGTLEAADGEIGPGDVWSWDADCVLPEPGTTVSLRVVHEPSDRVLTATSRPVEPGLADRVGVDQCGI